MVWGYLVFSLLQGDWAWLKRLPDGTFSNISPKTSHVFELVRDVVVREHKLQNKSHVEKQRIIYIFVAPDEGHAS